MNGRWYAISEWIWRVMLLNLLWLTFTLLGGVVLGFGPATAAAHVVARRFVRGIDGEPVREFVRSYRAQFWRANLILGLPAATIVAAVAGSVGLRGSAVPGGPALAVVLLACAAILGLCLLYLPALDAHYEIPTGRALSRAFLFAMANLPSTLVLVIVLAALVFVSTVVPGLAVLAGIGAWICLSSALCLRFFAQNDAALGVAAAPGAGVPASM